MLATVNAESRKHRKGTPPAVLQEIFWAKIFGALSAPAIMLAYFPRFAHGTRGPLWIDLVFVVWLACVSLYGPWLKRRWRKRLEEHDFALCLDCGYDVGGAAENICPECGKEFSLNELSYRWDLWLGMGHVLRKHLDRAAK